MLRYERFGAAGPVQHFWRAHFIGAGVCVHHSNSAWRRRGRAIAAAVASNQHHLEIVGGDKALATAPGTLSERKLTEAVRGVVNKQWSLKYDALRTMMAARVDDVGGTRIFPGAILTAALIHRAAPRLRTRFRVGFAAIKS